MKRWSWRKPAGAIRSVVVLGVALVTTLGVMYFTPPPL